MSTQTRSQRMANTAYLQIARHLADGKKTPARDFVSTVRKFPALIHNCGLAQAVSFALAKKHNQYLDDLAAVLHASGHSTVTDHKSLLDRAQKSPLSDYVRLSRDAIAAASWLKRYVEAAAGEDL
jgi:CRISPR-associated protein Cmr5